MVADINYRLWVPEGSESSAVPIRTRTFWESVLLPSDDPPTLPLHISSACSTEIRFMLLEGTPGFSLNFRVNYDHQMLTLGTPIDNNPVTLGWDDMAHPTPGVFRWTEALAIAEHFESRDQSPTDPSLLLLLLAPYIVIDATDDAAQIEQRFRAEIAQLAFFSDREIDEIMQNLLPNTAAGASDNRPDSNSRFTPVEWTPDETVGWTLSGGQHIEVAPGNWHEVGNNSLRGNSVGFPDATFVFVPEKRRSPRRLAWARLFADQLRRLWRC